MPRSIACCPATRGPIIAHVAKLDVIERILKEALRLWPTAPAFTLAPFEDEVIGGKWHAAQGPPGQRLRARPPPRSEAWDRPRGVRHRPLAARGGGGAPSARLQAVRQRRARLHRPPVRDGRGEARAGDDAAQLRDQRPALLHAADQGNAVDQARRFLHARPPATAARAAERRAAAEARVAGAPVACGRRAPGSASRCSTASSLGTARDIAEEIAERAPASTGSTPSSGRWTTASRAARSPRTR